MKQAWAKLVQVIAHLLTKYLYIANKKTRKKKIWTLFYRPAS